MTGPLEDTTTYHLAPRADELPGTTSVLTIVGGVVAYDALTGRKTARIGRQDRQP